MEKCPEPEAALTNGFLKPDPDMVSKIISIPHPKSKDELRAVLGLLQFVGPFIEVQRWFSISALQE